MQSIRAIRKQSQNLLKTCTKNNWGGEFRLPSISAIMWLRFNISKYPARCARQAATAPQLQMEVREYLKHQNEKMIENRYETTQNLWSPGLLWSYWATRWRYDAPRCESWAAFAGVLGVILAPRWAKLGPRWRDVDKLGA